MVDPTPDRAPVGALPPTRTLAEQTKMRESTVGIVRAFTKSAIIPTAGGRRTTPARPKPAPARPVVLDEDDDTPLTLADLRTRLGRKPTARPLGEEADGGFDAAALSRQHPARPVSGASLAAGALRAMRKKS